jgi:IS30 family transposase
MDPINAAIDEIESRAPGEKFSYTQIAAKHGVVRSTLARRHKGQTSSEQDKKVNQQKLNLQQEQELIRYIEELTRRRLPPTKKMVQNFASTIAKEPVSKS